MKGYLLRYLLAYPTPLANITVYQRMCLLLAVPGARLHRR